MIGLETERLIFRQWQHSDYQSFADFYSHEEYARFVGGIKNPEESWRLMATYIGHYELNGYSYLAIDEKETGNLIGTVGLWNSEPWPEPELGYWLLPHAHGKGFGVEAGIAVKEFALKSLKLKTLVSYIDETNEPSKKLALRLGAKLDKTIELLDFGPHEVYRYK
ncbi:MAG: GNAT family N-acetyltransferase [Reichenbachiella sp.]|uniref:GNAT family N-acetyltransferase n=1 Tax=Reichenbachiella sp. TaxID=2184521 RepID=UPI003263C935